MGCTLKEVQEAEYYVLVYDNGDYVTGGHSSATPKLYTKGTAQMVITKEKKQNERFKKMWPGKFTPSPLPMMKKVKLIIEE